MELLIRNLDVENAFFFIPGEPAINFMVTIEQKAIKSDLQKNVLGIILMKNKEQLIQLSKT